MPCKNCLKTLTVVHNTAKSSSGNR